MLTFHPPQAPWPWFTMLWPTSAECQPWPIPPAFNGPETVASQPDKVDLSPMAKRFSIPTQMTLTDSDRKILLGALNAAKIATHIINTAADNRSKLSIREKTGVGDLVTQADLDADAAIRKALANVVDGADMITEETYDARLKEGKPFDYKRAWIVDPIDGTNNFAHGFPFYATSIAYVEDGQPKVGVIVDIPKGDVYLAVKGQGAWRNGERLACSKVDSLRNALLSSEFGKFLRKNNDPALNNMGHFQTLSQQAQSVRRSGASALDGPYTAAGHIDGFWHMDTHPWDQAASMLITTEAGGNVSSLDGSPVDLSQHAFKIIGGNPTIHALLKEKLNTPFASAEKS